MAVATAHRSKSNEAARGRLLKSFAQTNQRFSDNTLPKQVAPPPVVGVPMPLAPPITLKDPLLVAGVPELESALRKRKIMRGKISADMRRSASTPHLRGISLTDTKLLSPTDKRRNKLGYHRTSVACGHCRRRKIRCLLPSPEDPHGRCANCIRLKKDCNFYPIEQSVPSEQRLPNTSSNEIASITQCSPSKSLSHPSRHSQHDLPEIKTQAHVVEFHPPESEVHPELDSPEYAVDEPYTAHLQSSPFTFPNPPVEHWDGVPAHSSHSVPVVSSYWNDGLAPISFTGAPEATVHQISAAPYDLPNYASEHECHAWVAPSRSISFSNLEEITHQHPYHEIGFQHGASVSSPSYHYTMHQQPVVRQSTSSEDIQRIAAISGPERQITSSPFASFPKFWGGVPSPPHCSGASTDHNHPSIYQQSFSYERYGQGQFLHSQHYYPEATSPG